MTDNQPETMTRQQAVDAIMSTWYQCASEFCVGKAENDASDRELRAALRALGVTDEEMNA